MKKGKLIILSAPSGAGKTSICKKLLKNNPEWLFSVSATTREKRKNEKDGKDYIFMKKEKFDHAEKFGEFIESEWVHGNKYGTLLKPIEDAIDNGSVIVIDVDVKGAMNLVEEFPDQSLSIFIEPPGINDSDKKELLLERMINRGHQNETLYKQRLRRFEFEIGFITKFSHSFINDNLNKTIIKIEKLIKEEI
tara:strand:- start:387 stop:965 length:579 start_codon:yes stop_codon:yes gene_type:complete